MTSPKNDEKHERRKKGPIRTGDGEDAPAPGPAEGASPDTDALAAERDDLLARLQRLSADYLNYQKRAERTADETRRFANAELIKELLTVLDDMERALEAARANHSADDPLLAGMQLVYDKALEILRRHGLEPIQAEGRPFDPTRHEAIMQQPSDEHDTPTVLSEFQRGYELKGRVLRPARVIVSAPSAGQTGDEEQGHDDDTESE